MTDLSTVRRVHTADLRVGDVVRVRSRDDILATLDDNSRVDGLPFMPEMLAFAGQELPIDSVVHRTCDTVKTSGTSGTTRGMNRVVHLRGVRCDGSAHGGCQAGCLIYWKEDWLESADEPAPADASVTGDVPTVIAASAQTSESTLDEPVYACQATEVLQASCFVSPYDPRIWAADIKSRNASVWVAVKGWAVLAFNKLQSLSRRLPRQLRIRDGRTWPWYGPTGQRHRDAPLDLRVGEVVEVKSKEEIEATLDDNDSVRGLRFGAEMLPYCGKQFRVQARVDHIIDEKTGRMLKLRDCIILEDVWCEGNQRLLCRRKIYAYWRETWLRRVSVAPLGGRDG